MAVGKCITGNVVKQNAGVVAHGGSISDSTRTYNLPLTTLTNNASNVGSSVKVAVLVESSGNLGTAKAIAGGVFSSFEKGQFVGKIIGKRIAQTDNTLLVSGANLITQKPINSIRTTNTGFLTALAWSSNKDGAPTYTLTQSAQAVDFREDKEVTTLGQLVYLNGSTTPIQADYQASNSH